MLSLAGQEIESADSAAWKIDIDFQTRRQQQACEQFETAAPRLGAAIPIIRGSDGEKYFTQLFWLRAVASESFRELTPKRFSEIKLAPFLHSSDWQRDDFRAVRRKVGESLLRPGLPER